MIQVVHCKYGEDAVSDLVNKVTDNDGRGLKDVALRSSTYLASFLEKKWGAKEQIPNPKG